MGVFKTFGVSVLLGIVAALFQYFVVYERWKNVRSLDRNDFARNPNWKVYQDSEIKTVYYEVDKLGEVLKEWQHGEFILYRLKESEKAKYNFDPVKELKSDVVARKLDLGCKNTEASKFSTMLTNCLFDMKFQNGKEEIIPAPMLLTEEGSGYSASFANFTNKDTVSNLWNLLKVPFSPRGKAVSFEQAFISNLKQPRITAPFHANPLTDSVAIQYQGSKTWLFLPPPTYVSMMKSTFAGSALFPKRSPNLEDKPEVYIYTSQPGDVLFFPESWGHTVYTYPGANVMFNFRQMYSGNFLHQPVIWVSAVIEHLIGVKGNDWTQKDEDIRKIQKIVPQKGENVRVQEMYKSMCGEEQKHKTDFDKQMLDLIRKEVERVTGSPFQEIQS